MTKKLTVAEVREARKQNMPVVFNLVMAVQKAISTPAGTRQSTGDFANNILAIFNGAKEQNILALTPKQVRAGLLEGGMDKSSHDVSTKLWNMAKSGALVRDAAAGTYSLA